MKFLPLVVLFLLVSAACQNSDAGKVFTNSHSNYSQNYQIINRSGETLQERINVPAGYERIPVKKNSFAYYLRNLPLKPHGAPVKMYDGSTKPSEGVYVAVVDMPIGNRDLHQCADAVMHLRADYLWKTKQFHKIKFNFTNGFPAKYSRWIQGERIAVKGNKTYWYKAASPSNSYRDFWKYLQMVFAYAGSYSLSNELKPVRVQDMKIGDVFIVGGFPGHAVIVVDMAQNKKTGKKIFLLAQSYMPAQEIQILINPNNDKLSPWYELDFGNTLYTPEYTFNKDDLKRFPE